MVSLKEACDIVLAAHPDQYIHVVNEFDEVFLFVMVRKGDIIEQYGFVNGNIKYRVFRH